MKLTKRAGDSDVKYLGSFLGRTWLGLASAGLLYSVSLLHAQDTGNEIRIIEIQGAVELMPVGASTWVLTQTNQVLHVGDRIRTGENSRLTLKWSDQSVVPFAALTEMEILTPDKASSLPGLNLVKGVISFFHRDTPGRIQVLTHGATASVEGTEFVMRVTGDGADERVALSVVDGKVVLANAQGDIALTNDQEAVATPGNPPKPTAGFIVNNLMQWAFYYPGVLDPDDLHLADDERTTLHDSLVAYRAGDLTGALAAYPASHTPASPNDKVFHAALLLSVGQVDKGDAELDSVPAEGQAHALAESLRTLIQAVKRQPCAGTNGLSLPSELLAGSYYEQSRATGDASLTMALDMAREAAAKNPQFGFAWERVGELEFGFGHIREAEVALDKSLALAPRNAQALALKGFLLAAQNRIAEAQIWFERAIAADAALDNAWLGRGLCRIRSGQSAAGRSDLLVAAALEPQRAVLRSYLSKAFSDAGKNDPATREIGIALRLDPGDPTGWLYSALLKLQQNRVNEAIDDLQKSQDLNDNRELFRSKMLLDQDKAVRSANLATMYRDAGMNDVSVREAAKAVSSDYDNASAHLFLSDSFNELRDPTRFNLRYETAWFNEFLLANLLAPVGAGRLSQTISAQEYSKLFESDGVGLAAQGQWRSDGQYHQLASQYGTIKNTSWALDLDYQNNTGVRPNNDLNRIEWYSTIKQQLTPADSVMLLTKYEDYTSGDNFQYYNPKTSSRPNYQFHEQQKPIIIGGYQHEWAPGIQTLLLGGRLDTRQQFSDLQTPELLLLQDGTGTLASSDNQPYDFTISDKLEIWDAEVQQIVHKDRFTVIAGARWQGGDIHFEDTLTNTSLPGFLAPPAAGSFMERFQRAGGYGYLSVEPFEHLVLTGGAAYDWMEYPSTFRTLPESAGTEDRTLLEPKAAFVWSPLPQATLRGIYSRSLGGVSLDESYRLEPSQLAGFVQTLRSVMPESVVGSVSAQNVELEGLALDLKFGHGTFAGLQFEHINSDVNQAVGDFLLVNGNPPYVPSTTRQNLNYDEQSLAASLNQLLPHGLVTGIEYRLTHSDLRTVYPMVPSGILPAQDQSAILHEIGAYLLYNHPSGFFARFDAHGYLQSNQGYTPDEPGDQFAQFDLRAGWRFFHRHGELMAGVLNLGNQDYRLNPLNLYAELPRGRVYTLQLSFEF